MMACGHYHRNQQTQGDPRLITLGNARCMKRLAQKARWMLYTRVVLQSNAETSDISYCQQLASNCNLCMHGRMP
jgi:hypothetical protein